MLRNKSIIFMGTPQFAVESLKQLLDAGVDVKAVVTVPDKPAGRGLKLIPSAVKEFALEKGIKILQPEKLKEESFLAELKKIKADLFVVVAFRMLPEVVWQLPSFGTINLHGSLLPQYRGAAPINWAVINGDKKTGATTFFIEKEIDTGNIIDKTEILIGENDTAGAVHDILMVKGAILLTKTVKSIFDGSVKTTHQKDLITNEVLKSAPKLFKESCKIKWTDNGEHIHNLVRGLSPYPTAFSDYFDEKNEKHNIKIFETRFTPKPHKFVPGYIECDNKSYLHVYCTNGFLSLIDLQLPGRKRMKIDELLRGYKFKTERFA